LSASSSSEVVSVNPTFVHFPSLRADK
jgi:hypothetical protein